MRVLAFLVITNLLLLISSTVVFAETRLALIITNQNYPIELGSLSKTYSDGIILQQSLEKVGFDVIRVKDVNKEEMYKEILNYTDRLLEAGPKVTGFFYYSGHGAAQSKDGDNFLIPTEARVKHSAQLPLLGVKLNEIIESISSIPSIANFVVIDACRNVAFTRGLRSGYKGLRREKGRKGVGIAFSTLPGEVAIDDNFYSKALASEILKAGQPATKVFRAVRRKVLQKTDQEQTPWYEDGIIKDFYFNNELVSPRPAIVDTITSTTIVDETKADVFCHRNGIWTNINGKAKCVDIKDTFKECRDCPVMVVVGPGHFIMGANDLRYAKPTHTVYINRPFAVSEFEITFNEWQACIDDNGCNNYSPPDWGWGKGTRPVINVSWDDAKQYINWINKKLNLNQRNGYRLLSEAEWEYTARANKQTPYAWGNFLKSHKANCKDCGGNKAGKKTVPVGQFPKNNFSLYDMNGNVWEWVEDCWSNDYKNKPNSGQAWVRDNCKRKVIRGGSWYESSKRIRSGVRDSYLKSIRKYKVGFRIARGLS